MHIENVAARDYTAGKVTGEASIDTCVNDFIHTLNWRQIPAPVQAMTRRCLLDLLGVAASGTQTRLSHLIREHSFNHFGSSPVGSGSRILFDGRRCSPTGAALAGGMGIDSVDAHDGYRLCKGHAGCGVLPAALALLDYRYADTAAADELLLSLLIGYEIACRAGVSLHASVADYHSSGAWVAVAAAAIGARVLGLGTRATGEALGIAEYHGPRSQMMRCVDHPTMLKDGSGWGAMAGVSAALLARDGFTGAPAITVEALEQSHHWKNLGHEWLILQQYFKPYPVCRWAQPAIVAALQLLERYAFHTGEIQSVTIGTFHESCRLATTRPSTTEQAQYSLPFPVAAALVHREVTIKQIESDGLRDEQVLTLSDAIVLEEIAAFNDEFPARRFSQVTITLKSGQILASGPTEASGDPELPLSDADIVAKFQQFAEPALGNKRCQQIKQAIDALSEGTDLRTFNSLVYPAGAFS